MSNCSDCKNNGTQICSVCCSYQGCPDRWEAKPTTNADRIRNMTDEELADWLWIRCGCSYCLGFENRKCRLSRRDNACKEYWLEWLRQEADT